MCELVLWIKGICYDQCILGRIQCIFALLCIVLQGQTCLLLQVSLDFLLLHSNPQWWVDYFFFLLTVYSFSIFSNKECNQSGFHIDHFVMTMCKSHFLCCWKKVFAIASAFSWQNSVSLCPASFCAPKPNLSVTASISWLPTFPFQSFMINRTSFLLVLVIGGLLGFQRNDQHQLLQNQ